MGEKAIMFENIARFFKKLNKKEEKAANHSRTAAKERLHLVLMQDRANVSADFLELMKQEIIEVIKKYIDVDEGAIDVRLTNKENEDGTNGAPALYANIPILNIKNEARKVDVKEKKEKEKQEEKIEEKSKKAEKPDTIESEDKSQTDLETEVEEEKEETKTEKAEVKIESEIETETKIESESKTEAEIEEKEKKETEEELKSKE